MTDQDPNALEWIALSAEIVMNMTAARLEVDEVLQCMVLMDM